MTPVIEAIDTDTFAVRECLPTNIQKGVFHWDMTFHWTPHWTQSQTNVWHIENNTQPIPSPTMAGGLFAIKKSYFEYLGTYDSEMKVWGGENLELSFRIWTCGGRLEIHPCSHVGHVFRLKAPYSHPGGEPVLTRNLIRVAEVWLDEFKDLFYQHVPGAISAEYGNITSRVELRNRLKCKSFRWYLDNVYPEKDYMFPSDVLNIGYILSDGGDKEQHNCVDSGNIPAQLPKEGSFLQIFGCHFRGGNQLFFYTRFSEIRHYGPGTYCLTAQLLELEDQGKPRVNFNLCQSDFHKDIPPPPCEYFRVRLKLYYTVEYPLQPTRRGVLYKLDNCSVGLYNFFLYLDQKWTLENGQIRTEIGNQCLEVIEQTIWLRECSGNVNQKFNWLR